jgi:hypothetical protein
VWKLNLFVLTLFVLNLSLLFVHEMDAARGAEWRMLPGLKHMQDPDAYRIFTALHIPLYAILLFLLLGGYQIAAFFIVDIFLVAHTLLHVLFHRHKQNGLKSMFSLTVIYAMGVLAVAHLALRAGW